MTQPITIQLAFEEADPQHPDPASVDAVGRSAFNALRGQGYTIQPAYTGAKGAVPLYEIVMQAAQTVYDNREFLKTLLEQATEILLVLLALRKEREQPAAPPPPEIIITIDNHSVTVQPGAPLSDQALLEQLLQAHPDLPATVTPASRVTITTRVRN